MPVFASATPNRRRLFRCLTVFICSALLLSTLVLMVGFLLPELRSPIKYDSAFGYYEYYYSAENNKKIALTFDDGPTPEDTRAIVEVLKTYNVPATFFFIGEHVVLYPEVASYVASEGYSIGNHTFTHSLSVHDSPERLGIELGATTRVIERTTGVRPTLYRPPYLLAIGIDPAPNPWIVPQAANQWALSLGYMPVGIDIDSLDWNAKTAEEVVANFENNLREDRHIALFHDTPHTAEALEEIIPMLQSQGYQIVSLEEVLAPLPARSALSPTPAMTPPVSVLESTYIRALSSLQGGLAILGSVALILLLVRLGVLGILLQRGHRTPRPLLTRYPLISVVIPAYNEEENIVSTIRSVLQNSYSRREVIVVNDGSTDNTAARVKALCATLPPNMVKLISIKNGGKARALNIAMRRARGEVVAILDADAVLKNGALHAFARHFDDPQIGAVAGKVYTASLKGLLNKFQALEYAVGQNIEKKAFSVIGAVGVVPGPAGAWRRAALLQIGGFSSDTLVEDQDMTLTMLRRGWKIAYEPDAVAYTETPDTLQKFLTQRFRWVYGMMQCYWKHLGTMGAQPFSPLSYALFPHTIVFSILLPFCYLMVDALLVMSLFFGFSMHALLPILFFTGVDMIYTAWGLKDEPEGWKLLWVVPLQRFAYRPLIYYTIVRGFVRAIEGSGSAWNKFSKAGDTQRFFEKHLALLPVDVRDSFNLAPGASGDLRISYKTPPSGSVSAQS